MCPAGGDLTGILCERGIDGVEGWFEKIQRGTASAVTGSGVPPISP